MKPENLVHIREIFEEKTGVTLSPARPAVRPLRRAALTVAAVVCCLGVTALAANGLTNGALMRFFQSGGAVSPQGMPATETEPLSEGQLLTIDRYTTEVNETQTIGDTTITFQSVTAAATTHDLITYCVFTVEAPEGAWTEAGNSTLEFEQYYLDLQGDTTVYGAHGWLTVQDGPLDNVKTVVVTYLNRAQGDNSQIQMQVTLENFWTRAEQERDGTYIAEGVWTFEVPLELQEGVSLVDEPVALCDGAIMLEQLNLSPLGGSVVVQGDGYFSTGLPERVIFSDGSSEAVYPHDGFLDNDDTPDQPPVFWRSFTFAAPTDLSDAVAVEFADGTRIDIP